MLTDISQPNTLQGSFSLATGSEEGPVRLREMGALMSSPTNPAPVLRVLPFALPLPNQPPRSTASSPGLGSRLCLPDPREEGDGTPGPCTGGPGPPTASPGPVAAPEQADVGTPQEAGVLWPRNQSRGPASGPEPRRVVAMERARRTRPAGPAGDPAVAAARAGASGAGCRAQGGAGGAGAAARYSPAPGLCIQGPGPSEPGAHGGRGAGAPASHPPGRRRLQSDCETARGREGAGRGRALAAWPAG